MLPLLGLLGAATCVAIGLALDRWQRRRNIDRSWWDEDE